MPAGRFFLQCLDAPQRHNVGARRSNAIWRPELLLGNAFSKRCQNYARKYRAEDFGVTYQVDYSEVDVPDDAGYLHARWRRESPVNDSSVYTVLNCPQGPGCTSAHISPSASTILDGGARVSSSSTSTTTRSTPRSAGPGWRITFCGAYNFDVPGAGYTTSSGPFVGLNQVLKPDGLYFSQQRVGMYRWHLLDPVAFDQRLRVTVQDLGWQEDGT